MNYGVEDLMDSLDEVLKLSDECYDEVDQRRELFEFDPDIESYDKLNKSGMIRFYTMREECELVGFMIFIIQPALHIKGVFNASSDVMYIRKEHRGLGKTLLELVQEDLKEQGVKWFTFGVKSWLDDGKLGKAIGCKLYENIYQREL